MFNDKARTKQNKTKRKKTKRNDRTKRNHTKERNDTKIAKLNETNERTARATRNEIKRN